MELCRRGRKGKEKNRKEEKGIQREKRSTNQAQGVKENRKGTSEKGNEN